MQQDLTPLTARKQPKELIFLNPKNPSLASISSPSDTRLLTSQTSFFLITYDLHLSSLYSLRRIVTMRYKSNGKIFEKDTKGHIWVTEYIPVTNANEIIKAAKEIDQQGKTTAYHTKEKENGEVFYFKVNTRYATEAEEKEAAELPFEEPTLSWTGKTFEDILDPKHFAKK